MTAAESSYGDLVYLVAQYSEDFSIEHTSERDAFDDFVQHSIGDPAAALAELDRLLAEADDDADLEAALNRMGFNYVVTEAGHTDERGFLLQLRGWLVESLAERPHSGQS